MVAGGTHAIDAFHRLPDNPVVNPKKNSPQPVTKAIRLKPSVTDYATFVATTSKVVGTTGVSWKQPEVIGGRRASFPTRFPTPNELENSFYAKAAKASQPPFFMQNSTLSSYSAHGRRAHP